LLVASPALAEEPSVASASSIEDATETEVAAVGDGDQAKGFISVAVQGRIADPIEVTADGVAMPRDRLGVPFEVTAGDHVFQARAGELTSSSVRVQVPPGGAVTVFLTLISPEAAVIAAPEISSPVFETPAVTTSALPSRERAFSERPYLHGAIAALSVGVVSLGVGSYFAFTDSHSADAERLWSRCQSRGCDSAEQQQIVDADTSAAARSKALAVTGFVGGGLGLATAGILYVLDQTDQTSQQARRVTPLLAANYVGVLGRF